MHKLPALAGALALLIPAATAGAATYHRDAKMSSTEARTVTVLRTRYAIRVIRNKVWSYQDRRHAKRSETRYLERNVHALPRLRGLKHYWWHLSIRNERLTTAYERARLVPNGLPPHYSAWLCIHRYEGSWTDGGSPYWGGLQMDWTFMSSYGSTLLTSKGTADHWTPLEQMWVAERAYSSGRGFYPWPNTARYCGLI